MEDNIVKIDMHKGVVWKSDLRDAMKIDNPALCNLIKELASKDDEVHADWKKYKEKWHLPIRLAQKCFQHMYPSHKLKFVVANKHYKS